MDITVITNSPSHCSYGNGLTLELYQEWNALPSLVLPRKMRYIGYSFAQSMIVDSWLSSNQSGLCVFAGHMNILRHMCVWKVAIWLMSSIEYCTFECDPLVSNIHCSVYSLFQVENKYTKK